MREIEPSLHQEAVNREVCVLCDGTLVSALVPLTVNFNERGEARQVVYEVRGHHCLECDFDTCEVAASVDALRKAIRVVSKAGDRTTTRMLRASIQAGEHCLALSLKADSMSQPANYRQYS